MFLDRLRAYRACPVACAAVAALLSTAPAQAQPAPAGAVSTPAAEMTPNERAQRDADKVFKWILIHSDKPRRANSTREEKPAAASARVKPAARVAEPAPAVVAAPALAETTTAPAPALAESPPTVAIPAVQETPPPQAAPSAAIEIARAPVTLTQPVPVVDDRDEPLRLLQRTEPKFPSGLLRTLGKGDVQVGFTVLPDGSVTAPAVLKTSDARLRPAALAAVAQWRFEPLRKAQSGVVDLVFDLD